MLIKLISSCFLTLVLLVCAVQSQEAQPSSPKQTPSQNIQLKGCIAVGPDVILFSTADDNLVLTGKTEALGNYGGRELVLSGTRTEPIEIIGYSQLFPTFKVSAIERVLDKADPILSAEFRKRAAWRMQRFPGFGFRFALPASFVDDQTTENQTQSHFVTQDGTKTIRRMEIPGKTFPGANFTRGILSVFVNRKIKDEGNCRQFSEEGDQDVMAERISSGNLEFMEKVSSDAAAGSWTSSHFFHIFRNGGCYEIAFELHEVNARNADNGCNVPLLNREDDRNLIMPILASFKFFPPNSRRSSSSKN